MVFFLATCLLRFFAPIQNGMRKRVENYSVFGAFYPLPLLKDVRDQSNRQIICMLSFQVFSHFQPLPCKLMGQMQGQLFKEAQ